MSTALHYLEHLLAHSATLALLGSRASRHLRTPVSAQQSNVSSTQSFKRHTHTRKYVEWWISRGRACRPSQRGHTLSTSELNVLERAVLSICTYVCVCAMHAWVCVCFCVFIIRRFGGMLAMHCSREHQLTAEWTRRDRNAGAGCECDSEHLFSQNVCARKRWARQ